MNCSVCSSPPDQNSPYQLLSLALSLIPISDYLIALSALIAVFLYNFFEIHFLRDLLGGFRGQRVNLTFNPDSDLYRLVASKCQTLRGRYLATPWLASPHFQTLFLNFFRGTPSFTYTRNIFRASDGGTIALDWLLHSDVAQNKVHKSNGIPKDDQTPLVIVVPGLTSDSNSNYLKNLVYNTAKSGWNVVVSNHRGLGGVSVTSDCFYNAGWTDDIRAIVRYLHNEYPAAPLYVIGTSIGANVLVKYLGEEGNNIPITAAVAICSPWDLLIGDRFIGRRFAQKLYDIALAIGLRGYAELHEPHFTRLANWEGIKKSRSIRDFDNHATVIVGKYQTVDTYYRCCTSANFVGNVSVPLLCINSLDDPLCTREAIPWDECRLNKNIILATTKHGGHLAFFEGIFASSLWWVRATNEFLHVFSQSSCAHTKREMEISSPTEPSIDHGPFVNIAEDGTLAAVANEQTTTADETNSGLLLPPDEEINKGSSLEEQEEPMAESKTSDASPTTEQVVPSSFGFSSVRRRLDQLSKNSRRSMWLLIYISIVSSWPLSSALFLFFKRKVKGAPRSTIQRR